MRLTGMEMFDLADAFSAQKPQDCIVVSSGNQIQKLQRGERKDFKNSEKWVCIFVLEF